MSMRLCNEDDADDGSDANDSHDDVDSCEADHHGNPQGSTNVSSMPPPPTVSPRFPEGFLKVPPRFRKCFPDVVPHLSFLCRCRLCLCLPCIQASRFGGSSRTVDAACPQWKTHMRPTNFFTCHELEERQPTLYIVVWCHSADVHRVFF